MSHRKLPVIPIVLVVLLFAGVIYAKNQAPVVGTFEELQALEEEKIKAAEKEKMEKAMTTPMGEKRSAASAEEVTQAIKADRNLTDMKRQKFAKAKSPMIWNTRQRATKDQVNLAAPAGQWYKDGGIKPK